ncbi:MAG: hypothetical protein NTZ65_04965 [Candidatus Berkelbacteria bacterium]|nr:hypothetical protein [Candidatus Berkelbacteria bacterium]
MDLSVVRERIKIVEDLEEENRKSKEMIKSVLENDLEYQKVAQQSKELNKRKKRLKDELLSEEGNQKLVEDIKANLDEINTLREILSVELMEYYAKNQTDEIKDANGEQRKFKVIIRLAPRVSEQN